MVRIRVNDLEREIRAEKERSDPIIEITGPHIAQLKRLGFWHTESLNCVDRSGVDTDTEYIYL